MNEDYPGLAMSRSFGDRCAASVGVISEPGKILITLNRIYNTICLINTNNIEITEWNFTKDDKFIVLGSDGVYEFINSDEVINIIKDFYLSNNIKGACEFIVKESSNRWINVRNILKYT